VYPVVFIDAIVVKVRDGQVTNKPFYVAIGVTVHGERDILGIWAGDGGEGAKFWLNVLTEIKNRGVADVLMLVCDGLKGLPDAVNTVWERTVVQTCVIHLLRNTFRYAARQDWDAIAKDLRPIYTAVNEPMARERFGEFAATWRSKYPAAVALWERAWSEFVPFLDYGACRGIRRRSSARPRLIWVAASLGRSADRSGWLAGGAVELGDVERGGGEVGFVECRGQPAA